jgi:hypothetical protein
LGQAIKMGLVKGIPDAINNIVNYYGFAMIVMDLT